ncbi:MAG TPA: hypothetical protein VGH31_10925, partial [Acidimicrobiales bacterium]
MTLCPKADGLSAPRGAGKGRPFALSAAQAEMVVAYGDALHAAGLRGDKADVWGARAFYVRFGDAATWEAMTLQDQLDVNVKIGRFVGWLISNQHLIASSDYVIARRPLLGRIMARSHAEFFAHFQSTAALVGFSAKAASLQWTALSQACAVSGRPPQLFSHADLDDARTALCAAGERLGHGSKRSLRTAMFG